MFVISISKSCVGLMFGTHVFHNSGDFVKRSATLGGWKEAFPTYA